MDPLTHGLASFAVTRTFFPRVSQKTLFAVIVAGTIADVDIASAWFGPSAFLQWHRTFTHSVLGAAFIVAIFSGLLIAITRRGATEKISAALCILPVFFAVALHLAMDFCQSDEVALLWPFRRQRYSADWVAHLDLWILMFLLCGVLLPRLFGLVTSEIGAKAKGPKGRVGSVLALVVVLLYIGARVIFHNNATSELESRTYRGEVARKWAALPEPASPFHWRGIVETERALHEISVDVTPGASFDPDAAVTIYKPEPSAALDVARNTDTARRFLQVARFPRANVEKTSTGYRVTIVGFPYRADSSSGWHVMAAIETDGNAVVRDEELIWGPSFKEHWISNKGHDQTLTASNQLR